VSAPTPVAGDLAPLQDKWIDTLLEFKIADGTRLRAWR